MHIGSLCFSHVAVLLGNGPEIACVVCLTTYCELEMGFIVKGEPLLVKPFKVS